MPYQTTRLKTRGVVTSRNRLDEPKEGALARAESLITDRDGLCEPRRGQPYEDPTFTPITTPAAFRRCIPYAGKLISHIGSALWRRDGVSSHTQYTGTFSVPESGFQIRDAQATSNLYITTSDGLRRLDSLTSAWQTVVVHQHGPLQATGATTGSSGFMADQTAVGYRAYFFFTDANGREIVSGVSQRLVVTNTSGGTRNVALTWYIPANLSTSHYWRIFRSEQTADDLDPPSDELQQCGEGQLSSANIAAGTFTFTDSTADSLRGETLYTSPSIEGPLQNNDTPPLARDLCVFRGYTLYANITGKHRFFLNLLGAGTSALRFVADNVSTTNGSAVVTSVATTTTLRVGMKVKAAAGIPSTARILSIDSGTQVTMTQNATATGARDVEFQDVISIAGVEYFAASATTAANFEFLVTTSGSASQNIEATALALVFVVNQNASATVYGFYDSAFDGTPGQMRFQERTIGGSSFQLYSNATEAWSPTLPTTANGTAVSVSDRRANYIIASKLDQTEAVPLGGGIRCGTTAIRRILALREAVILLSDTVGILTGTGPDNFRFDELDATTRLIGPETAVVVADAVYCMSNQGVVRITPSGVQIAGRDVERDLITCGELSTFAAQAFGVSYETDRSYILAVPTTALLSQCDLVWRYHVFSDAWTHAVSAVSCGVVDPVDNKLVLADGAAALLRRERKSRDRTDYADDALPINITSTSGTTLNLTSTTNLLANDLIVQSSIEKRIVSVNSATALTMESSAAWSNGAATAYRPIDCVLETLPFYGSDPGLMKQFSEIVLFFRDAEFTDFTVAFANDFFPNFDYSVPAEPANTGSTWTVQPTGSAVMDEQPIRILVPQEVQRCHWLRVRLTFSIARQFMAFAGISYRHRDLATKFQGATQ